MTLYDYLISLGHTIEEIQSISTLVLVIEHAGKFYIISFKLVAPLIPAFLNMIDVTSLFISVDLASDTLTLSTTAWPSIIGRAIYLSGVIYTCLDLFNDAHIRNLLRLHDPAQGCYYFFNKLRGHGYAGQSIELSGRFSSH